MVKKIILFLSIIILIFFTAQFLFNSLFISAGAALLVSFVFLIYLISLWAGPLSKKSKIVFYILAGFAIIAVSSYHVIAYGSGKWQQGMLLKVGGIIGAGELQVRLNDAALNTIREYYKEGTKSGKNLKDVFNSLYPLKNNKPAITDTLRENPPGKIYGYIYLDSISDDKIVLIGQDVIYRGIDENFSNYGGGKGKVQCMITITPKGGRYEVQN